MIEKIMIKIFLQNFAILITDINTINTFNKIY